MKKRLKITLIILGTLAILALIFFIVDYSRVRKQQTPIFCINLITYKDGGTKEYYGLGYKVIAFNKTLQPNGNNELEKYKEIKIGTWFMNYNDFDKQMRIYKPVENNNMNATINAVVVKANKSKSLLVMGIENTTGLYSVGFENEENMEFKQGQEILIYFNGDVMETYPAQLGKVGKIEILKEKSDIEIPNSILRYCYSSRDKVNITISELTDTGISFTITDTNEIPYDYAHSYKINKKVKNENYTGVGEKIGQDTENSTSGYTGTGLQYIWTEVDKKANIQSKDTEETLIINLPNISEGEQYLAERKKI